MLIASAGTARRIDERLVSIALVYLLIPGF